MKKIKKKFMTKHPNYLKNYLKYRRKLAVKFGTCMRCLKNPAKEGYVLCDECRDKKKKWLNTGNNKEKLHDYMNTYMKNKRIEAKKNGMCQKCFNNIAIKNESMCTICKNKYAKS